LGFAFRALELIMSSTPRIPSNSSEITEKKGLFLKYNDFKKLERIIEDYNSDDEGTVDFNSMKDDEKEILWKIKTIVRNMESVRLRAKESE
jgi:hypothetical protein